MCEFQSISKRGGSGSGCVDDGADDIYESHMYLFIIM